jgi:glycolate oxidase
VNEQIVRRLTTIVGGDNLITSEDSLATYSHDETPGLVSKPGVVVKPANSREISELLKLANEEKIPVTPRGGGTGLAGGSIPSVDGILLSLERMNRIKEIDSRDLMAVVEPGVITAEINKAAHPAGLFYPPDPASIDSCSIGGNIATGAGGARTVKYGTTRNYVSGLEVVKPTGEVIRFGGKLVKNATGYSLLNLIIGSEGTLAVITEATLRLLPEPRVKVDLVIPFSDARPAMETAALILRKGMTPAAIEFIEGEAVRLTEAFLEKSLPFSNAPIQLLVELDGGDKAEIVRDYEAIGELALASGASDVLVAEDSARQEMLWEGRRKISEALKSKGKVASEDVVVPRSRLSELLTAISELGGRYSVKTVSFGHAGDGNIHVNILKQGDRPVEPQKLVEFIEELFKAVTALGGMISGEHGIGLTKKDFLHLSLTAEEINLMKGIKRVFDPNTILNPGKIFDA